jgi:hypothetical protein
VIVTLSASLLVTVTEPDADIDASLLGEDEREKKVLDDVDGEDNEEALVLALVEIDIIAVTDDDARPLDETEAVELSKELADELSYSDCDGKLLLEGALDWVAIEEKDTDDDTLCVSKDDKLNNALGLTKVLAVTDDDAAPLNVIEDECNALDDVEGEGIVE